MNVEEPGIIHIHSDSRVSVTVSSRGHEHHLAAIVQCFRRKDCRCDHPYGQVTLQLPPKLIETTSACQAMAVRIARFR